MLKNEHVAQYSARTRQDLHFKRRISIPHVFEQNVFDSYKRLTLVLKEGFLEDKVVQLENCLRMTRLYIRVQKPLQETVLMKPPRMHQNRPSENAVNSSADGCFHDERSCDHSQMALEHDRELVALRHSHHASV